MHCSHCGTPIAHGSAALKAPHGIAATGTAATPTLQGRWVCARCYFRLFIAPSLARRIAA